MKQTSVTVGDLVNYGQMLMVFCRTCTHHKSVDPADLVPDRLKPDMQLEDLEGVFQCTRCASTNTGAGLKQSATGRNWR